MKKFPGTFIGVAVGTLLAVYLITSAPPPKQALSPTEAPPSAALPIKEIINPECADNEADLYVTEPKLFRTVSNGVLSVRGQATGARAGVLVELLDSHDRVLQKEVVIADKGYPCEFSHGFLVEDLLGGMYTVKASLVPKKNEKPAEAVSVGVKIGK